MKHPRLSLEDSLREIESFTTHLGLENVRNFWKDSTKSSKWRVWKPRDLWPVQDLHLDWEALTLILR